MAKPLKEMVKEKGLRLGYVAAKAGLTPFRFSRLLHGREKPRKDEIRALAAVLRLRKKVVESALS